MGHNCCIICDNQSAANQLHKIINADEETITWRSDDECSDYWQEISTIIRAKQFVVRAKWMPSHLDEPEKSDALNKFIDAQGDARWIAANGEADKLAAKGAALAQPPKHLMERERFRLLLTRSTQRMMAHIWACHAEYINADSQDAHEIDIPEHEFGLADAWQEEWDPFELLIPENVINEGLYCDDFEENCGKYYDMDNPDEVTQPKKEESGAQGDCPIGWPILEKPDSESTAVQRNFDGGTNDTGIQALIPVDLVRPRLWAADQDGTAKVGRITHVDPAQELGQRSLEETPTPAKRVCCETAPTTRNQGNPAVETQVSPKSNDHQGSPTNPNAPTEKQHSMQLLAEAKKKFIKCSAHFPNAKLEECGTQLQLLTEFQDGTVHGRLRIHEISGSGNKVRLRREWFKPLAWVLDQLFWTECHNEQQNLTTRRNTSITFLEIMCIVEALTGGMVGPPGGSYATKTAIVKAMTKQLFRRQMVTIDEVQVPLGNFLGEIPNVRSAAAVGFAGLPGLNRRACMHNFPGLHQAVGALLCNAAASRDKLAAPVPRFMVQGKVGTRHHRGDVDCYRRESAKQAQSRWCHSRPGTKEPTHDR